MKVAASVAEGVAHGCRGPDDWHAEVMVPTADGGAWRLWSNEEASSSLVVRGGCGPMRRHHRRCRSVSIELSAR